MRLSSAFAAVLVSFVLTLASFALTTPVAAQPPPVNGPRMSWLFFPMFPTQPAVWTAMATPTIDIMMAAPSRFRSVFESDPMGLSMAQYNMWTVTPALQAIIDVEAENQLGMFQFDMNTHETMDGSPGAVFRMPGVPSPTGDPAFRAAVARLVDKVAIATVDFAGRLEILDVPLIPPFHNDFIDPAWNYPFQYNGAQAQIDLTAAGYVLDPNTPNPNFGRLVGQYPWAVPFMRINALTGNLIGTDYSWGGGLQGLVIYVQAGITELVASGFRLRDVLEASGIPVVLTPAPKTTCLMQVKRFFGYHFYAGSWELDRDVDHLHDFYTSEFANPFDYNYMLFNGEGPSMPNGWRTKSTALENLFDTVKYAPNRVAMIAAARAVQAALWGPTAGWDPITGGMPSIILGHLSPLRTAYNRNWRSIVNMQGVGVGNWWSYLLGYNSAVPAVTTVTVGLADLVNNLNPVTAEWTNDWAVLENIYDPLIGVDPFKMQVDVPTGLANNWVVGTWNYAGETRTEVMFRLRSGLKWHPNGAITFPTNQGGDGGSEAANPAGAALTVDDVAYSWLYHQAQWGWFYSNCYLIEEVQTKNGPPTWPIPALSQPGTGLTATWMANPVLADNEVVAKMYVLGSLALNWLGRVPILPMFIWDNVLDAYAFDPIVAGAVIGSGPWILTAFMPFVGVVLSANRSYYLTTDSGSGSAYQFVEECFHRRGDAGGITGSGPGTYDGRISGFDIAYFAAVYSSVPYSDYPMPNYWRDDVYTELIRSPPQPPSPIPPFDGTGQESSDGINWGATTAYPWRVKNPGAGPAYLYVDFNYDHYVNSFDLAILGLYWGTDAGSGW